jgi:ABC-2 type transport system permease protein
MRRRPARNVYLYYRLLSQRIKAVLSYQTDFLIGIVATTVTQGLGLVFLSVIFQKIPHIQGWDFWEVAYIYAMVIFAEGAASFFFNGMWSLGGLVNKGEMDRILVRPIPPLIQVFTSIPGLGGLGGMVMGGVIMGQALRHVQTDWTFYNYGLLLVFILSAVAIKVSVILAASCQTFWSGSTNTSFAHMIHTLGEFARFPLSIYNLGVQALITVVVPYAFISFYPASTLFGKMPWGQYGWLAPVVAIYAACMAGLIFRRGLRRYESTGN